MKPCLILAPDYRVLRVVPWQRAATLDFQGKAFPVKHYTDAVKTASGYYQLPAVMISGKGYVKYFKRRIRLVKKNIFIRDAFRCAYCGESFDKEDLTIDHVYPKSKGGRNTWDNLITSCFPCNLKKGDRLDIKPLWKPIEPKSHQMFIVSKIQPEWKEYLYSTKD